MQNNMQRPTSGIVAQPQVGLSAARPASVQQIQSNNAQQQNAVSPVPPTGVPPTIPGMPNSRPVMDPMMMKQVLSTMFLQPQQSIGNLMAPIAPPTSANPLQATMPQAPRGGV